MTGFGSVSRSTVERMDRDVRAGVLGDGGVVADVVPVAVRRHDELERPVARGQLVGDPGEARGRGVDGDRLARALVRQDVDVRRDGPDDAVEALHGDRVWQDRRIGVR